MVSHPVANQGGKSMFGNEPLRPDSRLIAKALAVLRIVTALAVPPAWDDQDPVIPGVVG